MERLAMQNLIEWNNNKKRKPLIVWGARQVGKTYLVKDLFAEEYYVGKYIYIDFKVDDSVNDFAKGLQMRRKSLSISLCSGANKLPRIRC